MSSYHRIPAETAFPLPPTLIIALLPPAIGVTAIVT
jgi:hypothetical protein